MRRQFNPQKRASVRSHERRAPREIVAYGSQHLGLKTHEIHAQLAQETVIAAVFQIVCDRELRRYGCRKGGGRSCARDPRSKATRCDPADPVSRGETFGERAAVQHKIVAVKSFDGMGGCLAEMQFAIHVVLDQWHVMCSEQFDQRLFLVIRQGHTGWVLKRRHEPADADRMPPKRLSQYVEVEPIVRVDRYLHDLQVKALDRAKRAVKGRVSYSDDIAGAGECLQA